MFSILGDRSKFQEVTSPTFKLVFTLEYKINRSFCSLHKSKQLIKKIKYIYILTNFENLK